MIQMIQDRILQYVSAHGKSLTHLCLKLCRNRDDAEDLYQETWCKVCDKFHRYDEAQPFEPWLFTICVNTYKNQYNRSKRSPIAVFRTNEEKECALNNAVDGKTVFNEEFDDIRQIVNELDEKHRIVIILYYFREFSVAELASIIRIPQGTVKSRLSKAREMIRRRLEDYET